MFYSDRPERYDKRRLIQDTHGDILLELDIDDVDPRAVNEEQVQRIVDALNREFYPA